MNWITAPREERDSLLRKLVGDGLTASQIATHFENCSRNAVIGRVHRLKLGLRAGSKRTPKGQGRRAQAKSSGRPRRAKLIAGVVHQPVQLLQATEPSSHTTKPIEIATPAAVPAVIPIFPDRDSVFRPIAGTEPIGIDDLDATACAWPVNGLHGHGAIFCGRHISEPNPTAYRNYCGDHRRIAYQPR